MKDLYETYEHHGRKVVVRMDLKGKHQQYCLCYSCQKLCIKDPAKNCPIASMVFAMNCLTGITTPVWECPEFRVKE